MYQLYWHQCLFLLLLVPNTSHLLLLGCEEGITPRAKSWPLDTPCPWGVLSTPNENPRTSRFLDLAAGGESKLSPLRSRFPSGTGLSANPLGSRGCCELSRYARLGRSSSSSLLPWGPPSAEGCPECTVLLCPRLWEWFPWNWGGALDTVSSSEGDPWLPDKTMSSGPIGSASKSPPEMCCGIHTDWGSSCHTAGHQPSLHHYYLPPFHSHTFLLSKTYMPSGAATLKSQTPGQGKVKQKSHMPHMQGPPSPCPPAILFCPLYLESLHLYKLSVSQCPGLPEVTPWHDSVVASHTVATKCASALSPIGVLPSLTCFPIVSS
jgi:hypothetical protein